MDIDLFSTSAQRLAMHFKDLSRKLQGYFRNFHRFSLMEINENGDEEESTIPYIFFFQSFEYGSKVFPTKPKTVRNLNDFFLQMNGSSQLP